MASWRGMSPSVVKRQQFGTDYQRHFPGMDDLSTARTPVKYRIVWFYSVLSSTGGVAKSKYKAVVISRVPL